MKRTYTCLDCKDDINLPDDEFGNSHGDTLVKCSSCGSVFLVSEDAEFEDGMWFDKSNLCRI